MIRGIAIMGLNGCGKSTLLNKAIQFFEITCGSGLDSQSE